MELIQALIKIVGNGLNLFQLLRRLATRDNGNEAVLTEVNLFLERDYAESSVTERPSLHQLNWLSDGEISFLARLCLFSLLHTNTNQETLILLDEPEVHFNDYWKRQLVHLIDQALQDQYSHVLMTTHSSITLSDVADTNIWVLHRLHSFTEHVDSPGILTLGADPSDIIVHIFGAPSAAGAKGEELIHSKIEEILGRENSAEKIRLLDALQQRIGPSPWRFIIRRELYRLRMQNTNSRS